MDALIPPGSLDRIRRVRDWTVEANDLDNWGVVGMYGGGGLMLGALCTLLARAYEVLPSPAWLFMAALAASLSGTVPIGWPSTLPVHPLERSLGLVWGALPRVMLSILLHAVVLVLCEPLFGLAARVIFPYWPGLVEWCDALSGNPLGVVQGQWVFDGAAWSPGTWAARGIGFATVFVANSAPRTEQTPSYSPAAFVAFLAIGLASWPVAVATVLAATGVAILRSMERELPLPRRSSWEKAELQRRRHLTGLRAVVRDVLVFARPAELWEAAKRFSVMAFLLGARLVRMATDGGWAVAGLVVAGVVLIAPSLLGGYVLGAPSVRFGDGPEAQLAGALETLPVRSSRYVASRLAQAVPPLSLAAFLLVWRDEAQAALAIAAIIAFVTISSVAASLVACPVNRPLKDAMLRWSVGVLIPTVALAVWRGLPSAFVFWLFSEVALTLVAARRILRGVP